MVKKNLHASLGFHRINNAYAKKKEKIKKDMFTVSQTSIGYIFGSDPAGYELNYQEKLFNQVQEKKHDLPARMHQLE